ncbi:MAG: AsmA-like C-terminal region-containing protein [Candidatus Binataceae bacterium]|nr:AsmA-like C-terminal region-containing protein [Candidatus Binataceae bacterium]
MKALRIAALLLLVSVAMASGIAIFAYHNQDRIVKLVLARIGADTGLRISIVGSRLKLRSHLVVVLEQPRVLLQGIEVARLKRAVVMISYRNLIHHQGLPLYAVIADQPTVTLPPRALSTGSAPIPPFDSALPATIGNWFATLGVITRHLEVNAGNVVEQGTGPLAGGIELIAYHHRLHTHRWLVRFQGQWLSGPAAGVRASGAVAFGRRQRFPPEVILQGDLLAGGLPLQALSLPSVTLDGRTHGDIRFALYKDGHITGGLNGAVRRLAIRQPQAASGLTAGDFAIRSDFKIDHTSAAFPNLTIVRDKLAFAMADIRLDDAYSGNPLIAVTASAARIDLAGLRKAIASFEFLPKKISDAIGTLRSGQVTIDQAAFTSRFDLLKASPGKVLQRELAASATVAGVSMELPRGLRIPQVRHLNGQIAYSRGVLTLTQGSAQAGQSSVKSLSARANLSRAWRRIPYAVEARGELAAEEVYAAAVQAVPALMRPARERIRSLDGSAGFKLKANGIFVAARPAQPRSFIVQIKPRNVRIGFRRVPTPIELTSGAVIAVPALLSIDKLMAHAAGPAGSVRTGSVMLSASVSQKDGHTLVRDLAAEFHNVNAERWLPLMIDPADLQATGRINGALFVNSVPAQKFAYRVTGRLVLGKGALQLGFLRSPLTLSSAALDLDGRGMNLQVPAASIENSPVDLNVRIADFSHPEMRLDADAHRLDLTVMKFIRLPWSPPTPVMIFKIPVSGHLTARRAKLDKLRMASVTTDYCYDHGDWQVRGFKAQALGGDLALDLTGRRADDWIHIRTHVAQIDGVQLMHLLQSSRKPEMTGKLNIDGDLWGDTRNDFFNTLAGALSFDAKNGTLAKFRVLSLILGMIDLKSWLTANIPDPRIAGLPFDALSANFKGDAGIFYTDDLRMTGPVMDMAAQGSIDAGKAIMDMRIEMAPFNTVSWLLNKIPVIGPRLAVPASLLAAYFQVRGPVSNPRVSAKPITSVAELVKKTLGLPINVIRPNTVR